ncbi:hypothetical protein SCP_1101400 [Sparassis crispa]|uniref:Uncharacterized protein n=1 Tax=Sparassis crispa TaxID=139825 RepID=A0A401GZ77_9APHY|nr:hypothetical protein SCP_1101400 [Sparassis crispa]GBE87464.1 hypothetical protein SCP_1101400 [Sparassis crispa]
MNHVLVILEAEACRHPCAIPHVGTSDCVADRNRNFAATPPFKVASISPSAPQDIQHSGDCVEDMGPLS